MGKVWSATTRYSALIAIIFVWVIFVNGMIQAHLHLLDSRPLSYLGTSDYASYFKFGLSVGLVAMAVFYLYLDRIFKPTILFRNLYFTGLVMQLIVAFTPYQLNGKPQMLHWATALMLAAVLVFAPWFFGSSHRIGMTVRRISRSVTLLYLVILPAEAAILIAFNYYVVSELLNLVIFHSWIIYLTFTEGPYRR